MKIEQSTHFDPSKQIELTQWFSKFRENIVGNKLELRRGEHAIPVLYADWTASGRLYQPIEDYITQILGPYVANTHTSSTLTGNAMTEAYAEARKIIKDHVNADANDAIILAGSGMTGVVNKLQRMMGLRVPEHLQTHCPKDENLKPLVIVTHMEHHSNQTTWEECEITLQIIQRGANGLPDLDHLKRILKQFEQRPIKIGAFTGCSNVTGIITPYHEMAEIMHQHGGLCFVDFAASAPYLAINMHPENPLQKLDAIFFSPHKFLGGPGSSGVMVFNKDLYRLNVPDQPGGGTVAWTNPWGGHRYFSDIEVREDGGTPGFLQAIRAALAVKLKEAMDVEKIAQREQYMNQIFRERLCQNPSIELLESHCHRRTSIFSFYTLDTHYNLIVKILNDRFGIQVRGGCSCAGTYGHLLLHVKKKFSNKITAQIDAGDLSNKPGWVRASLHPTMTDEEVLFIADSILAVLENIDQWSSDYQFCTASGEFFHRSNNLAQMPTLESFRAY
ncbi:MAG: selenocysteine lyase [Gammaproteobacteria bacterium CG22_combo_CG10-13_8_21_14_all_40_8]|nr:MAG: selenocysteine lyase [Gammaproteobacteria bacterium CG22_combo_CG10-13_8_21_14_all_40_8]